MNTNGNKVVWWILGICITIVIGVSGAVISQMSDVHSRIFMLEARNIAWELRLDRIEAKIDRIVERTK